MSAKIMLLFRVIEMDVFLRCVTFRRPLPMLSRTLALVHMLLLLQVTTAHFRPNFVVNGVRAHEEDGWRSVSFGGELRFRVTGPCSRCVCVCI